MSVIVLVVDDEADQRHLVRVALEREGCVVAEASDGIEALDCLRNIDPAIIVLDLDMPRMDGNAFLEAMGSAGLAKGAQVVVHTGQLFARTPDGCLRLLKPVDGQTLRQLVRVLKSTRPH